MSEPGGRTRRTYWEQARAGGVYPWHGRGWLEVAGRDRAAFLHAFCTQEIKKLAPGDIRETFFCQGNGKIVGHGFVVVEAERLLIATPREHVAPLLRHLDRYVIREDVRLADRSDMTAAALFCGAAGIGLRQAAEASTAATQVADIPAADELVKLSAALSLAVAAAVVVRRNPWVPNDDTLWVEYPPEVAMPTAANAAASEAAPTATAAPTAAMTAAPTAAMTAVGGQVAGAGGRCDPGPAAPYRCGGIAAGRAWRAARGGPGTRRVVERSVGPAQRGPRGD